MNPMTGRPLALALTCLFVLLALTLAGKWTGLEIPALAIGIPSALLFWLQCVFFDFEYKEPW